MDGGYERAHRMLRSAFEELAHGRAASLGQACAPSAQWWLPVADGDGVPAADAGRRLAGMAAAAHAVSVGAVIVAPDASQAVVELIAVPRPGESETSATSVLDLDDGHIVAGRTYFDVVALP